MTGRAEKRKASTTHQSSSPPKKRAFSPKTPSPMKPAPPKTASMSRSERKKSKKRTSITEEQHTPPQRTSTSSPPNTPNSPSGPLKLCLNKGTAKSLLKHGSKITPLYKMLSEFAQIVMEKQPRNEQQFKLILDQLAGQLDSKLLERKTYSAISAREYDAMSEAINLMAAGTIEFADTNVLLGDVRLSESFREQVDIVNHVNVSKSEMGCRLNIGIYLANAVFLARKHLAAGEIAVFSEVLFEHENLPGIGEIGGNLDYITSAYGGVKKLGKTSNAQVRLKKPYLLVVEAKSNSTIGRFSSFYQLIAQLVTVEYHDPSDEGRWGCLTSGNRWDFYFLRKKVEKNVDEEDCVTGYELFEMVDVKADSEEGLSTVMGILIHLVGQFLPSTMSDLVNLKEYEEWTGFVD